MCRKTSLANGLCQLGERIGEVSLKPDASLPEDIRNEGIGKAQCKVGALLCMADSLEKRKPDCIVSGPDTELEHKHVLPPGLMQKLCEVRCPFLEGRVRMKGPALVECRHEWRPAVPACRDEV